MGVIPFLVFTFVGRRATDLSRDAYNGLVALRNEIGQSLGQHRRSAQATVR